MKFRKKPVVIEAERFFYAAKPWPKGVVLVKGRRLGYATSDDMAAIETPEGCLAVGEGDWIVTGVKGERYPVSSDIFDATYEPVTE